MSTSQITLVWDVPQGPVSGYNIYRGTSADNESNVPLNSTLIVGTTFTDNAVYPGRTYFYEITAVLNGVESPDSIEIKSAPVPFDPQPANVDLKGDLSFSVLGGTTVTNVAKSLTQIAGDVGVSPGTAMTGLGAPTVIGGVLHFGDFVAAAAQGALAAAYNAAISTTGAVTLTGDIGGQTLGPGTYNSASSLGITGTLVLDGGGNPDAVFIFQIGSTLTTAASNSAVVLIGGAQAGNVFWAVGSSATLGVDTTFQGNIMAQVSITANTGAVICGRLLAMSGAVTLDDNVITTFMPCLDMLPLPPSPPNTPPKPPPAPLNGRITSETTTNP